MISRNKQSQKIYETYHPQPIKQQIPAYTDQNNYSFSTKYPPHLEQQINTSRRNENKLANRRRNSQFALSSKQQNIKQIDLKIEAILKKHAGQKKDLQDLLVTQQPTINPNKQAKDIHKQPVQTKASQNKRSTKQHNQVSQVKRSQIELSRPYVSVKKQVKYETSKKGADNLLSQKIKILNQRIKKAEQQKKKLNIKFKPFYFDEESKTELKQQKLMASIDQKIKQITIKNEPFTTLDVKKTVKEPKKPILQYQAEPLGRIKHQKSSFKELNFDVYKVSNQQLTKSSQIIQQLLEALLEQIKLDQTLRNLKIWFTFYNQTSKWSTLKQKLANKKQYTNKQLKEIFQSNIEEHNPFFKWDTIEFNQGLQSLIQAYQNSQEHWRQAILNRWKKSSLQSSSLRQKIQYERRCSAVALQDLVRFINLQKDSFFRNRDLYLIYKRFCASSNKLSYQQFLNAITQRQQQ